MGIPFLYNNTNKQINGMIIGAKHASTVAADLVKGYFETKLFYLQRRNVGIDASLTFRDKYRRYLYDWRIMLHKRLDYFEEVLNLLNSPHPSIKFTSGNDDSKLNYFNITIIKSEASLITEIHKKKTLEVILICHFKFAIPGT